MTEEAGLPLSSLPIPKSFCCPITHDLLVDPVATVDGNVYERDAIERWFRGGNRTSPLTGLLLPTLALTAEIALLRAIEEYMGLRPELVRPEAERRTYQEAAEGLQAELLEKQARRAGALAGVKAKLLDFSSRLLSLRGSSAEVARETAASVGMALHALAIGVDFEDNFSETSVAQAADPVADLAFAPQVSSSLISGSAAEIPSTCEATLTGHEGSVFCLVSLDGGKVASASQDKAIKIWDVLSRRCEATLTGHEGWVFCLVSLDGGKVASGSEDGTIKVWDVFSRRCEATLTGHEDRVFCLVSLDGGKVASGSRDKTIKIWDVLSRRCEATLTGHEGSVPCLVSLDGGKVASGSEDKTVKIWDVLARRCEATLTGHEGLVFCLVSLDGGKVASGSEDGTIKVWCS